MNNKKLALSIPLIFLCLCSWVSSQSLVELAKMERARRAKLAQKKITVITNADLLKIKRAPAMEVQPVETVPAVQADSVENRENQNTQPAGGEVDRSLDRYETALAQFEDEWNSAEENVSQLVATLNALLQEFYRTDIPTKKEEIQRQMNERSLQLEDAKNNAEKAEADYNQARADLEKKKKSLAEINK